MQIELCVCVRARARYDQNQLGTALLLAGRAQCDFWLGAVSGRRQTPAAIQVKS